MITCSAFCLTLSERAERRAAEASGRMERIHSSIQRLAWNGKGEENGNAVVTALALEDGRSLPVVHGFQLGSEDAGEFSKLVEDAGGRLRVARDPAGTRPLYVAESGEWISTDHRFLRDEPYGILSPGMSLDVRHRLLAETSSTTLQCTTQSSFESSAAELAELIDLSVRERVQGKKRVAVAFSGGLDSSILVHCASKYVQVIGCSVFSARSFDEENTSRVAKVLNMELVREKVDSKMVARELGALDLPFEPSPMDKSLWCIYSIAARSAAGAGANAILLGQLADELFGGYMKYQRAAEAQGTDFAKEMMRRDVLECSRRGFIRDEIACCRSIEPRFPFADARILRFGLSVPVDYKIRGGSRKALLRESARVLGLPEELTHMPKKAAQYSSGLLKIVT